MSCCSRSALVAAIALAFIGRAAAVAPEVKDDGKFFSADALKKANDQVREIWAKYGRDVLVETFATPPADKVEKVKAMSSKERGEFFVKWALERAKLRVVNGVYMMLCKDPDHFIVGITAKARRVLPPEVRKKLQETVHAEFDEKHYDEGLLAAIKVVRERLAAASSTK